MDIKKNDYYLCPGLKKIYWIKVIKKKKKRNLDITKKDIYIARTITLKKYMHFIT